MSPVDKHSKDYVPSVLELEYYRYREKGWNTLLGILIIVLFYLTIPTIGKHLWTQYIDLITAYPRATYCIVLICTHTGSVIFYASLFVPLYFFQWKCFDKWKITYGKETRRWPWQQPDWPKLRNRTIMVNCINHFVIVPFLLLTGIFTRGTKARFDLASFPSIIYWGHNIFHQGVLYKKFHKVHHEYTISCAFIGEYIHPFEYMISQALPNGLCPMLLGSNVHYFTIFFWNIFRMWGTIDVHVGYEIPWSFLRVLPFGRTYAGMFTFWDSLMGTDTDYRKYRWQMITKYLKEEEEQKQKSNSKQKEIELTQMKKEE